MFCPYWPGDHQAGTGGKFTIYQPIILYRKLSADFIFNGYELLQQQVLIVNEAGMITDLVAEQDAGDHIEKMQGILSPGFINAHCHLELSHMQGLIPKHTGLVDFVLKVVNERHVDEARIRAAIEEAETAMLQNGIVAVGDICNNTLCIAQKNKGRMQYHNFIEVAGFIPALANTRFDKAVAIVEAYRSAENDCGRATLAPHAPYSVSPELFALINEFAGNDLLTIHNQETAAENEFLAKGGGDFVRLYQQMGVDISFFKPSGKTSLQTWLPYFTKDQSMMLVHDVCTAETDMEALEFKNQNSKSPIFICLCPNANLYIGNTLPDVEMLMQHTDNMVLGTDSLASNDQLSILSEMITLQNNFQSLPLPTLLKWATSNGARALQLDEQLGSFEKGKQPGVLLIDGVNNLRLNNDAHVKRIL